MSTFCNAVLLVDYVFENSVALVVHVSTERVSWNEPESRQFHTRDYEYYE